MSNPARAVTEGTRPLPAWPFVAPLVTYPVWWLSGIGEYALVLFALPAVLLMRRRSGMRLPKGTGIWLLLVLATALSVVGIDTGGRMIGFVYRFGLLLAVTTMFLYVYNAPRRLTLRRVGAAMTAFLLVMVVGAYLGLLAPVWQWRTPLLFVLPPSIVQNELVGEIVVRRLTQFNPAAATAADLSPRPSAPFLYTNGWGNAYSLTVPFVLAYLTEVRRTWRFPATLVLLAASVPAAVLTLNRGMFVGLAVGGLYCLVRAVLAGRWRLVLSVVGAGALTAAVVAVLPVGERIAARNQTNQSVDTRSRLYSETIHRTLESPLLGYGAPRPSSIPTDPALGTQGQLWTTMFSHGLPAAGLLVLWLLLLVWRSLANLRVVSLLGGAVAAMSLVEIVFYGFLPWGYLPMLVAGALMLRDGRSPRGPTPPVPPTAGRTRPRRPGRAVRPSRPSRPVRVT